MRNYWNWERFGEDIRRTVQDAVDSMDFRSLNQTITDTINHASGSFRRYSEDARQTRDRNEDRKKDWAKVDLSKLKQPVLYTGTGGKKAAGLALSIVGLGVGAAFFLGFLFTGLTMLLIEQNSGIMFGFITLLIFAAVFCGIGAAGLKKLGRIRRFQSYLSELNGKEYSNIRELARRTRKKEKAVLKDLEWMIEKRWFLQGHLDDTNTCLITSNDAYEAYRDLMQKQEETRRNEEEARKRQEQETQTKEEERAEKRQQMDPQIRAVIETGQKYIQKLRECNDAIPGEVVSEKISRMEELTKRIFERVEQDPDAVDDIEKLMEYYLPTAVKLLEAYEELDHQPVQGENIVNSKREIEDTLDTLNIAFEKLLDDLFQETAWDVSSDISVLKMMLAQEGLTEDDFKTGGKS
nr:5-bromo-4-chloroindolyl phosphate hydrolysis family protein [uncultured Sellimonas sp.]